MMTMGKGDRHLHLAIRSMPYETRLRMYEKEKSDLFYSIANLSASEVQEKHRELVRKWQI